MLLAEHRPVNYVYRVEVSGWDFEKSYFVEKSDLEWNELTGKDVILSREIPDGSLIFVRLLQPLSQEQSFPIPYVAEFVRATREGRRRFRLSSVPLRAKTEHETETVTRQPVLQEVWSRRD
jgi:hypothetical protein